MKFNEIKDKTVSDLVKLKKQLANEIVLMKMKNTLGQVSNPLKIRDMRKQIAKINTALTFKVKN